jgi:hypothetical protein
VIANYLWSEGFDENPTRIVKIIPTPILELSFSRFSQMQEISLSPPLAMTTSGLSLLTNKYLDFETLPIEAWKT